MSEEKYRLLLWQKGIRDIILTYTVAVYAAKYDPDCVFDVITTASLNDPAAEKLLTNVGYTAHVVVYEPQDKNNWKPAMSTKPRESVEEALDALVLLLQHALSTELAAKENAGDVEL